MHLLFFTDTFFPLVGGAEMVLHNLASQLVRRGDTVTVLAPGVKSGDCDDSEFPYTVVRYRTPRSKRIFQRLLLLDLFRIHRRYPVDVLHCHAAYPQAFIGAAFKHLSGVPVVVRPHGSDVVPGGRIRKNRRLERRLLSGLRGVDAVVAQGRYLFDLIRSLQVPDQKIHTINNGVDLEAFAHSTGYEYKRPYIVAVGNLIRRKGFDLLIQAYARLEQVPWDLLIAGAGVEENALRAMADELGVVDRVCFLGHVSGQEKVDLLRNARFFVSPSRKEPFSNAVLEALACGLPVVASAVDGNLELVQDGGTGYHFESDSVESLRDALRKMQLLANDDTRMRVAVKGFIARFDWPLVAERYRSLYIEVAQKDR